MAANIEIAHMWTLNDDRQSVKLRLPRCRCTACLSLCA